MEEERDKDIIEAYIEFSKRKIRYNFNNEIVGSDEDIKNWDNNQTRVMRVNSKGKAVKPMVWRLNFWKFRIEMEYCS